MNRANIQTLVQMSFWFMLSCAGGEKSEVESQPQPKAEDRSDTSSGQATVSKIKFDMSALDEQGLIGSADGKRAVNYEFKIPDLPEYEKQVLAIDPSLKFVRGSSGRIGAGKGEILCLGSTHQPNYKEILLNLSALPCVERIIESHFE